MKNNSFNGFYGKTIEFLLNLRANNNKTWFEENRPDYDKFLLNPVRELVKALAETVLEIDPAIDTRPSVGKTISRIYRDTRFSRDKSPLRAKMWIAFRQLREDSLNFPGFYFEIDPEYYCFGMGIYSAEKSFMDKFRLLIKENPDEFLQAISFYYSKDNIFSLEGESYKRIDCSDVREELKEWYKKKNFYLECLRPVNRTLFSSELLDDIRKGYIALAPLYRLLYRIHDSVS